MWEGPARDCFLEVLDALTSLLGSMIDKQLERFTALQNQMK